MQRNRLVAIALLSLFVLGSAKDASAGFCASCYYDTHYMRYRCRSTSGSTTGSCKCVGGETGCLLQGACGPEYMCDLSTASARLSVDAQTVLELAEEHPRLAMALLILGERAGFGEGGKVLVPPVRITRDDIELFFKPNPTSAERQRFGAGGPSDEGRETVYEFSMKENHGSPLVTLQVQVLGGSARDFAFPLLEVALSNEKKSVAGIDRWKVEGWRVMSKQESFVARVASRTFGPRQSHDLY